MLLGFILKEYLPCHKIKYHYNSCCADLRDHVVNPQTFYRDPHGRFIHPKSDHTEHDEQDELIYLIRVLFTLEDITQTQAVIHNRRD